MLGISLFPSTPTIFVLGHPYPVIASHFLFIVDPSSCRIYALNVTSAQLLISVYNNFPFTGSPFVCHVSAPARVIGAGSSESPDKVSVGDPYTFSVDSPTSPHVEVLGPARRPVPVQVRRVLVIIKNIFWLY